jgi:hypothetical protein
MRRGHHRRPDTGKRSDVAFGAGGDGGSCNSWHLLSNTGHIVRCDSTSGYDNTAGQFLLFGGYTNLTPNPNLNDTWQLTASTGS